MTDQELKELHEFIGLLYNLTVLHPYLRADEKKRALELSDRIRTIIEKTEE